jgi:uncharacterized membrane protein
MRVQTKGSDKRARHWHDVPMLANLTWSQIVLAGAFIMTGILHFATPKFFVAIMPKMIPAHLHLLLVHVSGVFEFLGGVGVLLTPLRPWAGIGLLLLLVAVFPANIQMLLSARASSRASAGYLTALWARLPLQFVLMWWVWKATLSA